MPGRVLHGRWRGASLSPLARRAWSGGPGTAALELTPSPAHAPLAQAPPEAGSLALVVENGLEKKKNQTKMQSKK